MNGIGKVNGGGAGGQRYNTTLGGEDENLVVKHIDLQGLDVFIGFGVLLAFQQTAYPFEVLLTAAAGTLLVFPVGCDTVFGSLVHIPGTDLHFKGNALLANHCCMQGLVHIGLGCGDVVLKPSGHQIEQVVDMTQNVIAVGDGIHNAAEGIQIVQFLQRLTLGLHFAIDGINVLNATIGGVLDAHGSQSLGDGLLDGAHERFILLFVGTEVCHDFVILSGVQIPQRGIFQFPLDLLHTKTVCQRCVDVHGLPALLDLLFGGLVLHGTHIVQPVSNLDQHHADIFGHGHEHFAQIFHLCLFTGLKIGAGQLGNTFHQFCDSLTKELLNIIMGSVGVFNAVVKQGTQNGINVQTHFGHDLCHSQRMNDVGGTILTLLVPVFGIGIFDRPVDQIHGCTRHILGKGSLHGLIMCFKGFHSFSSLSRAAEAAWLRWC